MFPSFFLYPQKQWIAGATTEARVAHWISINGTERGDDDLPRDGLGPINRYYFPKSLGVKTAYCFVAAAATDSTNGPSGVVCTSEDFRGVMSGKCDNLRPPAEPTFRYHPEGFDFTFRFAKIPRKEEKDLFRVGFGCEIGPKEWVTATALGSSLSASKPLVALCPIQKTKDTSDILNDYAECGLAIRYKDGSPDSSLVYDSKQINRKIPGSFCPVSYCPSNYFNDRWMSVYKANTCSEGLSSNPMETCLGGNRVSYPW